MSKSILDLLREGWQLDAACKGYPVSWWFPVHGANKQQKDSYSKAKKLCLQCLVKNECEDYAKRNLCDGIWGGEILRRGKNLDD
jgi:hypothetical protein